jgi:hypothetical protein
MSTRAYYINGKCYCTQATYQHFIMVALASFVWRTVWLQRRILVVCSVLLENGLCSMPIFHDKIPAGMAAVVRCRGNVCYQVTRGLLLVGSMTWQRLALLHTDWGITEWSWSLFCFVDGIQSERETWMACQNWLQTVILFSFNSNTISLRN